MSIISDNKLYFRNIKKTTFFIVTQQILLKDLFKILLYTILGTGILVILTISYALSDYNSSFNNTLIKELVVKVKTSKTLPLEFVNIYNQIHPITDTKGIIYNSTLNNKRDNCPCLDVASYSWHLYKNQNKLFGNRIVLGLKLEKTLTQQECLNYRASRYNFLYGNLTIEDASEYYFNEELENISKRQYTILVLMMHNPSLYNPKRHPERLEQKLNKMLFLIED